MPRRENSLTDDTRSVTSDLTDPDDSSQKPLISAKRSDKNPKSSLKSSHRRPFTPSTSASVKVISNGAGHSFQTPRDRFRSSVRKIMQLKRASDIWMAKRVGAEPGIDVRRDSTFLAYGHIKQKCVIELTDYSSVRSTSGRMTNLELVNYLKHPDASKREPWVKVRWINVGGISWDVISALALKYDLHPLAIEDIIHHPHRMRSKADYYPQHLFLRLISHTLATDEDTVENYMNNIPRSESPEPADEELDFSGKSFGKGYRDYGSTSSMRSILGRGRIGRRRGIMQKTNVDTERGRFRPDPTFARFGTFDPSVGAKRSATALKLIEELKQGNRVNVSMNPVCIFLLRDGTVISMHPKPSLDFTTPIRERLRLNNTNLRTTADASLLVHALLDLIVDSILQVVDEYQSKIVELEHRVLLRPNMKTVRFLHILSGDITLHKRTIEPIKTIVHGLRRYDRERVAAMYDENERPEGWKPEGYMSHKASIYLADVHDHMEYILTSLDMFAGISENLINYTFNMASYDMNEVMRKLTLVTIICLPLTLLTGYFGMNFAGMWSVERHSDTFFWHVAIPLMFVIIPLFTYSDLIKMYHYANKKIWAKKLDKQLKRA